MTKSTSRFVVAALASTISLSPALAAGQPSPRELADDAIVRVKAMAYRSNQVDWKKLEQTVREKSGEATDVVDLLPAFNALVQGLGDGHSFVNVSAEDRAEYKKRHGREFDSDRVGHKILSPFVARRSASVESLSIGRRSIAKLTVPMLIGAGAGATTYAQTVYDGLAARAVSHCGYIVDIRGNSGGNEWPMLVGLGPLLGKTWRSRELRPNGSILNYVSIAQGKATVADRSDEHVGMTIVAVAGWRPLPTLSTAPVAVLIDDATASSGEGVAAAFRGRPATRFFGQRTYGVASSNEGFVLADRVNIVVTTGLMVDRVGRTYLDGIAPDVATAIPSSDSDKNDPAVVAAKRWLMQQPRCAR